MVVVVVVVVAVVVVAVVVVVVVIAVLVVLAQEVYIFDIKNGSSAKNDDFSYHWHLFSLILNLFGENIII